MDIYYIIEGWLYRLVSEVCRNYIRIKLYAYIICRRG
jgi:hypothetical protein